MRFRLADEVGPWFPRLFVDAETLERTCAAIGMRIIERRAWLGGVIFGAKLARASSGVFGCGPA
jgi:hypothetical protein